MAYITLRPVRRLLLAALAGGSLAAGITAIATGPSTASDPEPLSSTEASARGEAGTGVAGLSATAEGIAITGADRMAARPSIVATSGRRVATETTVHAPGDLVTAHGVELSAAVIDGGTSAHAVIQHASYGHHDLGRLAVGCRNGVPTAERTGTVRLAPNVLVLVPADRVTRMVRIATVSCASPYQPRTAPPEQPALSSDPTTPSPANSSATPGAPTAAGAPAQPTPARESRDRIERQPVPHAPMPSTRTGHLTVTG